MVSVASYRLATHLGVAFVILGFIAVVYVLADPTRGRVAEGAARRAKVSCFSLSTGLMHFTFLQILLGALVAGIGRRGAAILIGR